MTNVERGSRAEYLPPVVLAKQVPYDPSHPYGLMSLIGRVGHPTVRTLLAHIPQQDQMRLMYSHTIKPCYKPIPRYILR